MTITDVLEQKRVYIATKGGTIVSGLQHPIYLAKDWHVYLLATTPEENERNQLIKEELERRIEQYKPDVDSFLEHYRAKGCDIHIDIAKDWLDSILLNEDLCNLPQIEGLHIRKLG